MAAKRKLSRATLEVLAAFLSEPSTGRSGSQLSEITDLRSGTLYPILQRLEDEGWLSAEWERIDPSAVKRPRRRFYKLTGLGEQSAAAELANARKRLGMIQTRPAWAT